MKAPFKRILAVLDRVASDDDVFARAIALAQQNDGHLMLTHCISLKTLEELNTLIDTGCGSVKSAKLRQLQTEHLHEVSAAWKWLCQYALRAQEHGVFAEVRCEIGDVCVQICNLAQQWNASLIVLGYDSKPDLQEQLLGNTSIHIVQYAPCAMIAAHSEVGKQQAHLEISETSYKSYQFEQQLA